MKGIVFTEFLEYAEVAIGSDLVEDAIQGADLASSGAYTAVGTYDHRELVSIVCALARITAVPAASLVRSFGRHLFGRFHALYPRFFEGVACTFDFLEQIESHIHAEVKKLYPDAELPRFQCERLPPRRMLLTYTSVRGFSDLAEGLIEGCAAHFGERITMGREDLSGGAGTRVRFDLTKDV